MLEFSMSTLEKFGVTERREKVRRIVHFFQKKIVTIHRRSNIETCHD
jgi:hypothetical protein